MTPPASSTKSFSVMGKIFDPSKPNDYVDSFRDQARVEANTAE